MRSGPNPPSEALNRTLLKKPRTTGIAVTTDITIVATSGSQSGRWWSACQIITTNKVAVRIEYVDAA
jgi:hypothetical protein